MSRDSKPAPAEMPAATDLTALLEEIRLTSLNLAIAAAKITARNSRQDRLKNELAELVTLSLESVEILTRFLAALGQERSGSDSDEIALRQRIEENFQRISGHIDSIASAFLREKGLT